MENVFSPSLPIYASGFIALVFLLTLIWQMRILQSPSACFLVFAIAARFLSSAFHQFTFSPSPIGLSYTALVTVTVAVVGSFVVRRRQWAEPALIPIFIMGGVIVLSGLFNLNPISSVGTLAKYAYFAIVMLAFIDACEDMETDRLLKSLLLPLSIPFVFQIASLIFGVAKAGENDGSASFIGGFDHEAAFSISLACGLAVICLIRDMKLSIRLLAIIWCLAAILLANYRTAIIAMAPLVFMSLMTFPARSVVYRHQGLVRGLMLCLCFGVAIIAVWAGQERFADLASVASEGTDIIKSPEEFSEEDKRELSGRPFIWSNYVDTYLDGSPVNRLIGFGADSWQKFTALYAHNSLVSALYEFGIVGVLAMIFLWAWMAWIAVSSGSISAMAAHISFFILAMATMPMWLIEGLLLFGLICGYGVFCLREQRSATGKVHAERRRERSPPKVSGVP